ncbi:hypothetical protein ABZ829_32295 [Streptomyces xanthochromogenes]|uniref:hypothetical protein n=1 Tax=Streptomyces xanthochromogenes TaxID=67384 RepID=UPI00343370F2
MDTDLYTARAQRPGPRRPQDLHPAARGRCSRVDIHTAKTDDLPAGAFLTRPDAHMVWAAAVEEPAEDAVPALREALPVGSATEHPA